MKKWTGILVRGAFALLAFALFPAFEAMVLLLLFYIAVKE